MNSEEGKSAAGHPSAASSLHVREESEEFDIIEHVVRPRVSSTTVNSNSEFELQKLGKTESTRQALAITVPPNSSSTRFQPPTGSNTDPSYHWSPANNISALGQLDVLAVAVMDQEDLPQELQAKDKEENDLEDRSILNLLQEPHRKWEPTDESALEEDEMDEEFACAPPRLAQGPNIELQIQPGAIAVAGPGIQETNVEIDSTESNTAAEDISTVEDSSGLVVANLVAEDLPQAEELDMDSSLLRKDFMKRLLMKVILAAVIFIFLIIMLVILIPKNEGANMTLTWEATPSAMPSQMSSQMPTSSDDYIMSLLPGETILAITEQTDSPQSKAWQWLLEDMEFPVSLPEDRIMQRFALVTLFYSTGGEAWTNNDSWLDHQIHECEWYNSPDFANKEVISNIYEEFLAGYMEPMPHHHCNDDGTYQHLWLNRNNLVGALPQEIYMMTSLQTLSGVSNSLHGEISTFVGQLTALHGIAFSDIKGTGAIPSEVGLLTNLQVFQCRNCGFQGHIPMDIWRLSNLSHLILPVHPQLQGSIPAEIGRLSMLTFLILDRCDLSGSIPSEFGELGKLHMFTMNSNKFTGTLPTEMGLLSSLTLFPPRNNLFHGTVPSELGQLTLLTTLTLRGNRFHGTVPSELGLLTNLTITLNLRGNSLSGTIPTELGVLSRLQELDLQGNQLLSGQIPSELGQLSSVGHLTFANNSFSGTVPYELSALQPILHTLTLEGNPLLSGTIPEAVCNFNGTCVGNAWDECDMIQGLSFDCTSLLCGCNCTCWNSTSS
ncbi:Leucine-rich repeat-containing protein [Seminavis robusta]|uniref:Leucine-rich repeat-containing protein n=1 Tax=Seminavis robusta TaxID=568900 RepID=A0A9N8DT55_9STRA|nr:Leucine-rich repeat-containing protein [Seminavis robusta]|eukprot:Sro337_g120680.1 Leucine-rich repeat-containing protein (777) ;mRNA; r:51356-53765